MLRFDINLLFTVINVLIMFFVVWRFLMKPIRKIMDKRREEVEAEYAKAEEAKNQAEDARKKYAESLDEVAEEKANILTEAHAQANRDYDRIVSEARTEAEEILRNAKTNANEEKVRSLLQAKGEIAGMVAEAAAKIVTGSDSPENDKELYDRFLEKAGVRGK